MAGSLLLTSDSTGSSQNITSTLELATRTAAADEWVVPSVRLSSLNGAAATITLTWRHYASNGTTLIREQAYSFAKPQTASTVAGDDMPAVFIKSGEKLTIAAKSSNASDNAAAYTISWANGAAADVQQVAGTAQTARDIGASVLVGDKTGFSLAAAGLDLVLIESSISASADLTNDTGTQLTSINARQALALFAAALEGVLAGAATTSITIKGAGKPSGNTRVTATVDSDGNRSALTLKVPD